MLCLYLEAPFAVCRTFTAGWYRPTATFLTPSAAYGLLLNIAGIESRVREEHPEHDGKTPASLMRRDLPSVRMALGVPADVDGPQFPKVQTIFQQLHNYPVGKDAGMAPEFAKGNKNNITPVRREFLSDLRAWVCVDGPADLEACVRRGLRGESDEARYGLPFLGDNQFLVDRLEERPLPEKAVWYERLRIGPDQTPLPRTTRLTVWIDRADMSRTVSYLYAPAEAASCQIPENAWTSIEPR